MGQIQSVTGEVLVHKVLAHKVLAQVLACAREEVGAETVGKTVIEFPGLSQFI